MTTQDVSKKGLKYGDEDEDQAEKKELAAQKIAFGPLIEWLKKDLAGQISDGKSVSADAADPISGLDQPARHFAMYHCGR